MNFAFTEEQELFRRSIDEAAAEVFGKNYKENAKLDYNPSILKKLRDMDLLGFGIPEEYGGQGMDVDIDPVLVGIICETLGKYDVAAAGFWYSNYSKVELLYKFGSEEQRKYWFPKLAAGEVAISGCFTEPQCGTDLSALQTTATQDGDGFILNGLKASVTYCEADAHLILARVDKSVDPTGKALFLVPAGLEGMSVSTYDDFGLKQIGRGDLALKDVKVGKECLLGQGTGGFRGIMNIFDLGRPTIALFCTGAAYGVLEKSLEYTKQRTVFGKQLCSFEAVSFGFAEHYAKLDSFRLMAYKAMWKRANGMNNTKEAAMAKFLCCEEAFEAIWFATRVLGHLGYTSEHDALSRLADVMGYAWGDGSWEACKMVAAREIGGRELLPYSKSKA